MRRRIESLMLVVLILLSGCAGRGSGQSVLAVQPEPAHLESQVSKLAAMPAPAGVSDDVWEQLRAELLRLLQTPGAERRTSAVPTHNQAAPNLFVERFGSSGQLIWRHTMPGDYDQNGVVNISDLTPLGIHFGEAQPGGFADSSVLAAVDGDGNGEINVSDVTPIGQHFGESMSGYELFVSTDFGDYPDSNGEAPLLAATESFPLTEMQGDTAIERLFVEMPLMELDPAAIYWVRPVSGGLSGTPSNRIFGAVPPDVLSITVSPDPPTQAGTALVTVAYKLAPGITDASVAWQVEGEGNGSIESFGNPVTYTAPELVDDLHVTIVVAVSDGQQTTFEERTVQIWAGSTVRWHSQTVASSDTTGMHNALFATSSGPMIAFSVQNDEVDDQIVTANASDSTGTDWIFAPQNDPPAHFQAMSGAYIGGQPALAVSYSGGFGFSPFSFGSFSPFLTPPGVPFSVFDLSMAQVNGQPAVAFNGPSGGSVGIHYSRAINYQLSTWNAAVPVASDPDGPVGSFLSLVDNGGRPAVAYLDSSGDIWTLRYAIAADATGGSWDNYLAYESPGGASPGRHCRMDIVDGRPAIAFQVSTLGLHYIRALDSLGESWPTDALHLDAGGEGLDIEVISFQPAIAYEWRSGNGIESELRYIRALDAQGSSWAITEAADEFMNGLVIGSSIHPCLKEIEGRPAISYYDPVNSALKYAVKY